MKKIPSNLLIGSYKLDKDSKYVCLRKMLNRQDIDNNLVVPLGVDEESRYHYMGFDDIGCLLVVGETGSGKSIFLDSIIISLVLRNTIDQVRFIMIDPKRIELSYYNSLPHMHSEVVSNSLDSYKKFLEIKKEYKRRRDLFTDGQVNDIDEYNNLKRVKKLYRLFVIVDEVCDLMKNDGVEELIKDMVSDCYEVGIHIIIATNSYNEEYFSKKFIDKIKYRVIFDLASRADASLVGVRDTHNLNIPGEVIAVSKKQRVRYKLQTPYISDSDIMRVIDYYCNKDKIEV